MSSDPTTDSDVASTRVVIALISSVVFLAVINGTMINIALPYLGRDFEVSEGTYGWISTGYSLAFGIFNAIDGKLGDIVGMRRLYLVGLFTMGAGALAMAIAPSIEIAIAIRILQGAGAAALPVLGSSIITRVIPDESRGAAMGVILSTVGVAASIGPFIGGFLVEYWGWRAVFLFASVALLVLPVAIRILPKHLDEVSGNTKFDLPGAVLLGIGIASVMYGFELIKDYGITSTYFHLSTGTGLLFLGLFWWRIHTASDPFVPPAFLRDHRYLATAFSAFLSNATRFGTIILVPIFLTEVNGVSPIMIGVALFPGAVAIAVLSRHAGTLADRAGAHVPIFFGTIAIVLGNLVTAYYAGASIWGVAFGMGLYGIGFAGVQSPAVTATSIIVPKAYTSTGMGVFMMIFFIGGAVGVALSVTTVELQAVDASSWLGFDHLGEGARYSNGILMLTALALLNLCLNPFIPRKDAEPITV